MKPESLQAPPNDWTQEPGLIRHVAKLDGALRPGGTNAALLTDDAIRLAIARGRYLRSKAYHDALDTVARRILQSFRLLRRTLRDAVDERRAVRELSALNDHLLRDVRIERVDVRTVVKSGTAAQLDAHQVCDLAGRSGTRFLG